MGDRLLAIWLGNKDTGYTFITNDKKTNNANLHKPVPYTDIEGVWTYIHFSYANKKAVGIVYANKEAKTLVLDVEHQSPKKLRFILGGNDLKLYPGFNG